VKDPFTPHVLGCCQAAFFDYLMERQLHGSFSGTFWVLTLLESLGGGSGRYCKATAEDKTTSAKFALYWLAADETLAPRPPEFAAGVRCRIQGKQLIQSKGWTFILFSSVASLA